MPGSTVHVTNLTPPEPLNLEYFSRFVNEHTSDETAKGLISEFLANNRPDLALTVLLIDVLGGPRGG
jgi:hypothetical protein